MNKQTSHAFNKDCYLIGTYQGEQIWLEAASWDCGWYWGFGFIETYTQINPALAKDIISHQHWAGLLGTQEDGSYKHHINEVLKESVLTDAESWELSDLMQSFYTLQKAAEYYHTGGSGLTSTQIYKSCKNKRKEKAINTVDIPRLFPRIYDILTPT